MTATAIARSQLEANQAMDKGKVVGIGAMATRMSVLARALPMRILLVDTDELERSAFAERLNTAGFEVICAKDGRDALELINRQWFPLVLIDGQQPGDGIALIETLRARGTSDTYVSLLTRLEADVDYERGYAAGADDYLTRQLPDAGLTQRIHAAFNTIALRRSLQEAQQALIDAAPIDARTGAFSATATLTKLQAELHRTQRYGRKLSVLLIGMRATEPTLRLDDAAVKSAVAIVQSTIRTHVDWVGHVEWTHQSVTLAVVLPEAAPSDGPKIKERLRLRLLKLSGSAALAFDFGLVGLEHGEDRAELTAQDLLDVADHCRVCAGRVGPAQLRAVQRSVAVGATIACRHGYALDSQCALMLETDNPAPRRDDK